MGYSLSEIASHIEGLLIGDPQLLIEKVSPLDSPEENSITFILDKKFENISPLPAKAVITFKELEIPLPQIIIKNPKKALAKTLDLFFNSFTPFQINTSTQVQVSKSASLHASVKLSAFVSIGNNTTIKENTQIHSSVSIGSNVSIGKNCTLHPSVVIYDNTQIGDNVIINAGTVIGSTGFGYYTNETGEWIQIPQVGKVIIEDNVEIGSNTSIDRGCIGNTLIKKGTKLDNLIHIAHNTKIGKHCAIAGQVGFTGSATVEDHVMIAGQVGIDNVTIGKKSIILGKAGVTKSIKEGSIVSGFPAWEHKNELKKEAFIRKKITEKK